jgi:hypothetical protein
MFLMNPPFPLTLTDRFALIMRALHEAVAARIRCPPVTAEIIVYVCNRLRRIARDFEQLAARIRAGKYVARPAGRRRAGGAGSRAGKSIVLLHWNLGLPPWAPGWLHRIAPGDAGMCAEGLRRLLSEPEMAAVIAAVPRMRRILHPLCFMLKMETRLLWPSPPAPSDKPAVAGAEGEATAAPLGGHAGMVSATVPAGHARPVRMVRIPDMPGAKFFPA